MRLRMPAVVVACVAAAVLAAVTAVGGWWGAPRSGHAHAAPKTACAAQTPAPDAAALRAMRANELGRIPVLMYHSVGARGPYDRRGLNIPASRFRKHLEMMHRAGWYPVNVRDAMSARLDVPPGKTPVALTFDDARGSQLRLLKDGSIDPNCAVGILCAFSRGHRDWPLRATFYVMPRSQWNPVPFWQPGKERRKLQMLVDMGFEVGNHSVSHRAFTRLPPRTLAWEVAECVRGIRRLEPRATMDTLALPYGAFPRSRAQWDAVMHGTQGGTSYANRCIVIVGGGAAYPPAHRKHNPMRVARIGSDPGNIEVWVKRLRRGGPVTPYVSDGRPDIVSVPRRQSVLAAVSRARLDGAQLVAYDERPAAVSAARPRAHDVH